MTRFLLALGSVGLVVASLLSPSQEAPDRVVVITGDIRGYLSPCGCTKPMMGGVKRMATVVRSLTAQPNVWYVDLGNWTEGKGRQDQLKADALAELFAALKPSYLNVGAIEAGISPAELLALDQIAGGRLASDSLQAEFLRSGDLPILGLLSEDTKSVLPIRPAREALLSRPDAEVVLFAGNHERAHALAEAEYGNGRLLIYSHRGDPPRNPEEVNGWTLVSVGDKCRYVGRIERINGKWTNFRLIELGPEHNDDSLAHRLYESYLMRVDEEGLLDQVPRTPSEHQYVGSQACASCHPSAFDIWKDTNHAHAYATLVATKNHRDPECVGCHVVGLTKVSGFVSVDKTPDLKDVGCESCHGPGSAHIVKPTASMKAGPESCQSCHVPDHSPGFQFDLYWDKIKH
ncbi:MAG: hypothetical protein KatS3mg015_0694 [Fimbriimonadales bacterium]|nr:MAG: hypothetical protein KatS3mg015_0694 [Fimbriimonadales bacterium]